MKKLLAVIVCIMLVSCMTAPAFADDIVAQTPIDTVIDYGWVIFAAVVCLAVLIIWIIKFLRTPRKEQIEDIRKWLLQAVLKAEAVFGSKTGELKLSVVYDMFVERFPWLAKIVPFSLFHEKVKEALVVMRQLLAEKPELIEKAKVDMLKNVEMKM